MPRAEASTFEFESMRKEFVEARAPPPPAPPPPLSPSPENPAFCFGVHFSLGV